MTKLPKMKKINEASSVKDKPRTGRPKVALVGNKTHIYEVFSTRPAIFGKSFPRRVVGLVGAIEWPARSPDLTPCDFFRRGHFESVVYKDRLLNFQDLITNVTGEARTIVDFNLHNLLVHSALINAINVMH